MKAIYARHAAELNVHSWDTVFLSNHDNPRLVSSFGDDSPDIASPLPSCWRRAADAAGHAVHLPGRRAGNDELSLQIDCGLQRHRGKNGYKADVVTGKVSEADYMANLRHMSRDNARTPMQWDTSANGGFTTGAQPWLAVIPITRRSTPLRSWLIRTPSIATRRRMIELRHKTPALVYGDLRGPGPDEPIDFCLRAIAWGGSVPGGTEFFRQARDIRSGRI